MHGSTPAHVHACTHASVFRYLGKEEDIQEIESHYIRYPILFDGAFTLSLTLTHTHTHTHTCTYKLARTRTFQRKQIVKLMQTRIHFAEHRSLEQTLENSYEP